ncbi:MAG: hypothetical protein F9K28_11270 [Bacteroidetes bacterium]|nr:MAG: hypothetical protein F9K28_11270 [Bacteroidota bacterium]
MMIDELKMRWYQAFGDYDSLKASCEAQVNRWEWAKNQRYELRPYYFERFQQTRGRVLKAEPEDKEFHWQYGLDTQNRVVVTRQYTSYPDPAQPVWEWMSHRRLVMMFREEFTLYHENFTETVEYSFFHSKIPVGIRFYHYQDTGQLASFEELILNVGPELKSFVPADIYKLGETTGSITFCEEHYYEETNRLTRIEARYLKADGTLSHRIANFLTYTSSGRLEQIVQEWQDISESHTSFVYRRTGKSLKVIGEEYKQKLFEYIPEILTKAKVNEPVYCMVLTYNMPDYSPQNLMLALGLESERQRILEQFDAEEAQYTLWTPIYPLIPLGSNTELNEIGQLFQQLVSMKEAWNTATKLFDQTAAELMKLNWAEILATTSDFVIYAADYEIDDIKKRMKASVPSTLLAQLRKKGWL